jgi:uncharacterized membrane protein YfcA
MEIIGYIASVFIGITLGLIGGGGSILTVPVLVYFLGIDPILATTYSLFIVGVSSSVGAILKIDHRQVDKRSMVIFGVPLILTVFVFRKLVVPIIPQTIFQYAQWEITKGNFILFLFALFMLLAAWSMLRPSDKKAETQAANISPLFLSLYGILIGSLTGLLGAGGGFIIIPALVFLGGLEMKEAVGTSLVVMSVSSLIGFSGDLTHTLMDWKILGVVTGIAVAGVFIGNYLTKFSSGKQLKTLFGIFTLTMSVFILIKELFFLD